MNNSILLFMLRELVKVEVELDKVKHSLTLPTLPACTQCGQEHVSRKLKTELITLESRKEIIEEVIDLMFGEGSESGK